MREKFIPDLFLDSVYDMDLAALRSRGIRAFLFDIDNTLAAYDDPVAPPELKAWFLEVRQAGFLSYIVSNNHEARVKRFAASLDVPYYAKALKPRRRFLLLACRDMAVPPTACALVGDQLLTDIYGGNRLGMYTVFVKAISDKEHWFVHLKRRIERQLLKGRKV